MNNQKNGERIDRLERIYLSWITNATIFLASGPIIRNVGKNGKYYSIILYIAAISLFIVPSIDYIEERKKLTNDDIDIPLRLDLLFIIIIVVIIVIAAIASDYSINDVNISKQLIKKITSIFDIDIKKFKLQITK